MANQRTIGADTVPDRLRGVRVLVVDDDHDARTIMKTFLQYLGAGVALAGSGAEALRVIPSTRPQVIVTMPRGDGYHLLHALHTTARAWGRIPIIAVTAYGAAHSEARARAAGFDHWICKPIDLGTFADAVERLGRLRRAA